MTSLDDIRRIAARLPGAVEGGPERFGFSVMVKGKAKGFIWSWAERVHPKKARVPNNGVLAVRVRTLLEKDIILGSRHPAYFTEPHYDGYPAVLIRLDSIEPDEIAPLIEEAWRTLAPPALVREFDARS